MYNFRFVLFHLLMGVFLSANFPAFADQINPRQPVFGAGPSTHIVSLFFKQFSKRPEAVGFQFPVPERSTKHAGESAPLISICSAVPVAR